MFSEKARVSTGIESLDRRLDGLFIGDNVIWYDEAGSLAFPFCLNFIQESRKAQKPLIYISFDRSPKTLLEELGPLSRDPRLIVLDCFTCGKGDGSEIFAKFYRQADKSQPCRIVKVDAPSDPEAVSEAIYTVHKDLRGDVRLIFESLTGMQDLWGGEEGVLKFYSHACPRLYELDTVAYWIMEKGAHSSKLKAHLNQIAQVAIELSLRRGKSSLCILKAHNRRPDIPEEPELFWVDALTVVFESDKPISAKIDLGSRLKRLRVQRGMAQKELAGLMGVTPSTISQIESNTIYPSLPALFKLSQLLSVDAGYFFQKDEEQGYPMVFSGGKPVAFPNLPKNSIEGRAMLPADFGASIEAFVLEIASGAKLPGHFFIFKGDEFGYLLAGRLQVTIRNQVQELHTGDVIYLSRDVPSQWRNPDDQPARLLWMKIA